MKCLKNISSIYKYSVTLILLTSFDSTPKAEWAFDSEAMRASGIILVKSN